MKITLAKALKVKNRLAGRLTQVESDVEMFNSFQKDTPQQVDVRKSYNFREDIVEALILLKTNLILANAPIQETLIRLGELKVKLAFLQRIPTREGITRSEYAAHALEWVAAIKKSELDESRRAMEAAIDELQDKIDNFNQVTQIELPQRILDLAS